MQGQTDRGIFPSRNVSPVLLDVPKVSKAKQVQNLYSAPGHYSKPQVLLVPTGVPVCREWWMEILGYPITPPMLELKPLFKLKQNFSD